MFAEHLELFEGLEIPFQEVNHSLIFTKSIFTGKEFLKLQTKWLFLVK